MLVIVATDDFSVQASARFNAQATPASADEPGSGADLMKRRHRTHGAPTDTPEPAATGVPTEEANPTETEEVEPPTDTPVPPTEEPELPTDTPEAPTENLSCRQIHRKRRLTRLHRDDTLCRPQTPV